MRATSRSGLRLGLEVGAGLVAAGLGVLGWASLIERNAFVIRRFEVPVLPEGAEPLRVLHVSDLHLLPRQRKKSAWIKSLASLDPDLVVNTGDNLSHPEAIAPLLDALGPLMDFPGVFVPGSNDYFAPSFKNPFAYFAGPSKMSTGGRHHPVALDTDTLHAGFGLGGWVNLSNRAQSIPLKGIRFDFSGVDDPHLNRERYAGWPRGSSTQDSAPHVKIAVAHAPYQRVLDHFTAEGADLILAGHTHGGQVCLPGYGALVSNCDLPTWRARGLNNWDAQGRTTPVNVSAGIGTARTAPFRFACRPEAVVLTLTAKS